MDLIYSVPLLVYFPLNYDGIISATPDNTSSVIIKIVGASRTSYPLIQNYTTIKNTQKYTKECMTQERMVNY